MEQLSRQMISVLRGDMIRHQHDGWVKQRTLARFLNVSEKLIMDVCETSIRDDGKPLLGSSRSLLAARQLPVFVHPDCH